MLFIYTVIWDVFVEYMMLIFFHSSGGNRHVEVKVDTDTVDVSLVTGNIRQFGASHNSVDCGESSATTSTVAVRNDYTIAVNAGLLHSDWSSQIDS